MKTVAALGFSVCVLVALAGCSKKPIEPMQIPAPQEVKEKKYDAPLKPGQLALARTDPKDIPDFTPACADTANLKQAVAASLNYLSKESSTKSFPYLTSNGPISHAQAVASLQVFAHLLDTPMPPSQFNAVIRQQFDVYHSVGCDGAGTVLFTGYFTPILEASAVRGGRFQYPLYSPPPGLLKRPDGSPTTPMPDRKTIETTAGLYAGSELVWLGDPFEAYVTHIQGSARLKMIDGKEMTIGYAANNGWDYRSVREELVKDGKIGRYDGLLAMMNYFQGHPNEVFSYTWRNPRYIFFTEVKDGRPRGCLNEPVTTRRSIATDKKIFPPGCLAFYSTKLPQTVGPRVVDNPYVGFALDQDAGGAIQAAGRCDIYLGIGKEAGELAGRTQSEGRLYYLFLKPAAPPIGGGVPPAQWVPAPSVPGPRR